MVFALGKIFWTLMNPGVLIALLVTLGTCLLWAKRTRFALALLSACSLFLLALTLLNFHGHLARPLENRFPLLRELPERVDGIIVLGGAINLAVSQHREQVNMNDSAERLTAVIPLARRYPDAKILFSGGSGALFGSRSVEADWAQPFFEAMGLPPHRIIFEGSSRNTYENIRNSLKLVPNAKHETWLLITSASHMPRAVGVFRKVGWPVTPHPVDYRTSSTRFFRFDPLQKSLPEFSIALKEWMGLLYYRLMGYTGEVFPGPGVS